MLRIPRLAASAIALAAAVSLSPTTTHAAVSPDVTHVSATTRATQRTPLQNMHIDAAHIHWKDGGLRIGVIKQKTLVPADSVYLNLQRAYDPESGVEVSRFTVPSGQAGQNLSFLGKPGSSYWYAPQDYYSGWRPLWAGVGADVPDDKVADGTLRLELVKVDGPSWFECFSWSYSGSGSVTRLLSSRDSAYASVPLPNDSHSHPGWVFGAPGTYTMHFRAVAQTPEGKTISSPVQPVVWQVGPGQPKA